LAGTGLTFAFARRHSRAAVVVTWWLGLDLIAATLSARGLTHYVQQAEPALCLAVAMIAQRLLNGGTVRALAAAAATAVVAWLASIAVVLAPGAEVATVVRVPLASDARNLLSPRPTVHYLFRGWERLLRVIPASTYEAGFGVDTARVQQSI